MRITLSSKLVNSRVAEGSAFTLTASFFDDSSDVWATNAPTSTKYRIDRINGDPSCSSTVLDWTSLSPATSNAIAITGAQNAITDTDAHEERRQVIVRANDGLATQYEAQFKYSITNLPGIS